MDENKIYTPEILEAERYLRLIMDNLEKTGLEHEQKITILQGVIIKLCWENNVSNKDFNEYLNKVYRIYTGLI